jgi:hypothetical protein
MVGVEYLTTAVTMAGILVVVVATARALQRDARQPTVWDGSAAGGVGDAQPRLPGEGLAGAFDDSLTAYVAGYLVLVSAVAGGALLYVRGYAVGQPLLLLTGGILAGFAFVGVYLTARDRDHTSARATAEGASALVALLVVAVVAKLFLA